MFFSVFPEVLCVTHPQFWLSDWVPGNLISVFLRAFYAESADPKA